MMNGELKAPTSMQVVAAIARREIAVALKRRLVKMLFIANLVPPLVMAVVLVVTMVAKEVGFGDLGFDPLLRLLQIQFSPVLLLALGIGTPIVSRDRSEDVLFLYATRPVTPWSYTLGKMLAVALPSAALLLIPGVVMSIVRLGLMEGFSALDSVILIGKVAVAAFFMSVGFAGVSVGPSAATKRARWALLLALMCTVIPDAISELIWRDPYALDPARAAEDLLATLFDRDLMSYGIVAALCLLIWGALGALVTATRVRREMTP